MIGTIILVVIGNWILFPLVLILLLIFLWINYVFIKTSLEITRLE